MGPSPWRSPRGWVCHLAAESRLGDSSRTTGMAALQEVRQLLLTKSCPLCALSGAGRLQRGALGNDRHFPLEEHR